MRAKKEVAANNPPLTLSQLCAMKGEKVWVDRSNERVTPKKSSGWMLVELFGIFQSPYLDRQLADFLISGGCKVYRHRPK